MSRKNKKNKGANKNSSPELKTRKTLEVDEKEDDLQEEEIQPVNLEVLKKEKEELAQEISLQEAEIKQSAENARNPLEDELANNQKILQEKEEAIKSKDGSLKESKNKAKDLQFAKTKITNEIGSKNNEITKLGNEVKGLEGQLKSPVKESQSDKSSVLENTNKGQKSPAKTSQNQNDKTSILNVLNPKEGGKKAVTELAVPQLPHLPHTGELFQHNGQDYLAITHWEDYDEGKREAERLNAKLCAKGENNG